MHTLLLVIAALLPAPVLAEPPMNKKPIELPAFEPGPPLQPAADLRAWLEKESRAPDGQRRRFRLPVTLRFAEGRLGVAGGALGSAPDAITVALDDSALGVSLSDRARVVCSKEGAECTLWLVGYWGPLIQAPGPAFDPAQRATFAVLVVAAPVTEADAPLRAWVEAPARR